MQPASPAATRFRPLLAILAALAFLIANSLYLAWARFVDRVGMDEPHLPATYQTMLLVHLLVGLLAVPPAAGLAIARIRAGGFGAGAAVPAVVAAGCFIALLLTGCFLLSGASVIGNPAAFSVHQAATAAAVAALFAALWRIRGPRTGRALAWCAAIAVMTAGMVAAHLMEGRVGRPPEDTQLSSWNRLEGAVRGRAPGEPDPDRLFYPSPVTTSSGGLLPGRILAPGSPRDPAGFHAQVSASGFAPDHLLGAEDCAGCHRDIAVQWAASAHRYASFNNPFYRRSIEVTRDTAGRRASRWCASCHDPALLFEGDMTEEIDPLSPLAQAGLACIACHAIDRIHSQTGNGHYNLGAKAASPYLFSESKAGIGRFLHDFILKAQPQAHNREMMKPFFKESIYCGTCHKVGLDEPLNHYRWLRGQNEYDAWHNSGYAKNNPMTWYEPEQAMTCQDCHMPAEPALLGDLAAKDGMVKSHRFLGVNTALPFIRGDSETLRLKEESLKKDKIRVDIFALHRNGDLVATALDRTRPRVAPGDRVRFDVVVRNLGVGHAFPGGTTDINEGWLEFKATGPAGLLWHHGHLGQDRRVDPKAHFFKAVLVDQHSQRISRHNPADIRATVYSNVIGPGSADLARYILRFPEDLPEGILKIEVMLRWRKFNREFTEFVYEGREVPDLPVTTMASAGIELEIRLGADSSALHSNLREDWMRYNDYGIASFLDRDTRTARFAFRQVSDLAPDLPDGFRNQARAYLRDAALDEAESLLRLASERGAPDARTTFFWGRLHEERGGEWLVLAEKAYRRVLDTYPESRDAWDRLGRVLLHLDRFGEARECWEQVLRIDPESALAYEKYAQALEGLAGRAEGETARLALREAADLARAHFQRFKEDENADPWTLRYRQIHPEDHRMSQQFSVYEQEP